MIDSSERLLLIAAEEGSMPANCFDRVSDFVSARTSAATWPSLRRLVLAAGLLLVLLLIAPALASAEPLCNDMWTGPSEGEWQTSADWSTKSPPTSKEVACIGSGKTVKVTMAAEADVVQGAGAVKLASGSLEVFNAIEASVLASLTISGGKLTGGATVEVSSSFSWTGESYLEGSGSLVVKSGATASIAIGTGSGWGRLVGRSLVNEGTTTFSKGQLFMSEGSQLKNTGTFDANSESGGGQIRYEPKNPPEPSVVNTGTFQKTEGTGTTYSEARFENRGTVEALSGGLKFAAGSSSAASKWHAAEKSSITYASGAFALAEASWSGAIDVAGGAVTLEKTTISAAQVTVSAGSLGIETGPMTVASLTMSGGSLTGTGTLEVATSFSWTGESYLEGGGSLVIKHGATATIAIATGFGWARLVSRSLLNEGTVTFSTGQIFMSEGSEIQNAGTFDANSEYGGEQFEYEPKNPPVPSFVNTGTFQKIEGTGTTVIGVAFVNSGTIEAKTGKFKFLEPISPEPSTQYGGAENPSTPGQIHATCGEDPVSCASGNLYESQTDVSVGGRGVGLDLTRTYNAQAAAAGVKGIFGYGWSSSFSDHLILKPTEHLATLVQANGSTVPFTEAGSTFTAPAWTQDTLSGSSESGYALTLPDQSVYRFAGASGRLESVTDRYGNATTLTYNSEGHPEVITDPTSRKLTLKYNSKHLVETATDPAGHITKYEYDETEDLAKVVKPGETTPRWHFEYESHLLTTVIDGREGKTINKYNKETNQLIEQTDPMKRVLTFTYAPFETRIKNVATGSETLERFTSADLPYSITRGYGSGSASETTEAFTYDGANDLLSVTDGNGHATKYTYEHGNRMSMVDPEKGETRWTYDSTHDVKTMTTPRGELTTIEREADGNAKFIEREAPKKEVQKTEYKYKPHGELEVVIDPLKREWKYEYDTHGNRTAESDPEGDKRTWVYDEDSRVTSSVSPNGHVEKATEAKFKTTIKRDEQERPIEVIAPLSHKTTYKYDKNGNLESQTDPELNTTTYTYNADNEPTKVDAPNKSITETEYDGAGQVESQTDANKHKTVYTRNALEEVIEVKDPLSRATTKKYDGAGNLTSLTDPEKHTTTYTYDADNRLKEISYSDGKTPTVKYEYDADGDRTKMVDGTGTTTYEYDLLDRLTESKGEHSNTVGYKYNLANEQTAITYPAGTVTRTYDNAGRLKTVTDWTKDTTTFGYDADSNLTSTTFPTETTDKDTYTYDETDAMKEAAMSKGVEVLASLVYTRNKDDEVTKATTKGLPGEEKPAFSYDENSRLTKGAGIAYKYDPANNSTTIGTSTYVYDEADELKESLNSKRAVLAKYTFNELGARTKTAPTGAGEPATTYGYDEAGNLISVTRPKEGSTAEISDSYGYDGNGLRASQDISGATTYVTWDVTEALPLMLNDGTNSYIYGPGGLPVEQISGKGATLYLHHDEQGSTRMLTGSSGASEGTATYDAYGNKTGGTATTPMGYGGQYTSADTGLIYLRARAYDPVTGQFVSADPLQATTGATYGYALENPLTATDVTGLESVVEDFVGTVEAIPHTIGSGEAGQFFWNEVQGFLGGLVGANTSCLGSGGGFGVYLATGQTEGLGGNFSTFTRSASGQIDHYTTYTANPQNPTGFEVAKRFDRVGRGHFNKASQELVETPHVHEKDTPGGVRPAEPDEIPLEFP